MSNIDTLITLINMEREYLAALSVGEVEEHCVDLHEDCVAYTTQRIQSLREELYEILSVS